MLQKRVAELETKLLTAQAELVNYRKRKDEETSNLLKFANQDIITETIGVLDNFERAMKSAGTSGERRTTEVFTRNRDDLQSDERHLEEIRSRRNRMFR